MNPQSHQNELILASSSPYRQALLARLSLPFTWHGSDVDESVRPAESTPETTERLAQAKAESVAAFHSEAFIIGSDQLAECAGHSVGKPGTVEKAIAQLQQFSGRSVNFYTSVAVLCKATGFYRTATVITKAGFRTLTEDEIRRYVALDKPLDCAGAFKSEAAGLLLMQELTASDPTAIIGLPLIALGNILREAGFRLP